MSSQTTNFYLASDVFEFLTMSWLTLVSVSLLLLLPKSFPIPSSLLLLNYLQIRHSCVATQPLTWIVVCLFSLPIFDDFSQLFLSLLRPLLFVQLSVLLRSKPSHNLISNLFLSSFVFHPFVPRFKPSLSISLQMLPRFNSTHNMHRKLILSSFSNIVLPLGLISDLSIPFQTLHLQLH